MERNAKKVRRVAVAVTVGAALPLVLALSLNLMRPDLMVAMLSHELGYRLVLLVIVLCCGATALYLAAALTQFKTRSPKILLGVIGALFFTLPSLLVLLLGAIYVALYFGAN